MNRLALLFLFFLLVGTAFDATAQTESKPSSTQDPKSQVIETSKFRFYDTRQIQGEENYEIRRVGSGPKAELQITAKIDLPFMGEEEKPSLSASLRTKYDLTPQSFEIKGIRPLGIAIQKSIRIEGKTALVREAVGTSPETSGNNNSKPGVKGDLPPKQIALPENFFTFGGYVPVTMEMMLVRYWLAHGRKNRLPLVPAGEAFIEYRGQDIVKISETSTALSRYQLSGKNWGGGWGRQTLWFDSQDRLIAAVNLANDMETNLTAIRDGYDSGLTFFLKRAVEDGIERLTNVANQLSPISKGSLVVLGGTLIEVTGKPPITNSAVVIQRDRIVAAGPRSQVKIPAGATIIDASGKYLLPGLWDMHAHLYQLELGPAYLAAGITTARDVGNEIEFATTMRDAARQGRGLGPRMLLAGYIDGKNDYHSFDVQVGTPDEARAAVQRYKDTGFEQIKIRDHVKPDILKVITVEAHRLGMTVTGHVPEGMNAIEAVEAGMDQLAHLNYVETGFAPDLPRGQPLFEVDLASPQAKKAMEVFTRHHTVIDPTVAVLELMVRPMNVPIETFEPGMTKVAPELLEQINKKGAPAEAAEQIKAAIETLMKLIGALHRAGVPLVAGSDVGVPGYTLHRELELYVKAGLTPLEAIQAATLTPARVMKLEDEVGSIDVGKRADMIIVAENPLENISNIRKIEFVVAQGRVFDCSKLRQSVGFKP